MQHIKQEWNGDTHLKVTREIITKNICAIYYNKFLNTEWKWLFSRQIHGFKSRFKKQNL